MPCLANSITRARISRSRSITTWCRKACGRTRGLRPATRSRSSPRVREGEDAARAHTPQVVPAKAGTHNHRTWLLRGLSPRVPRCEAAEYGSRLALRLAGTTINAAGRVRMMATAWARRFLHLAPLAGRGRPAERSEVGRVRGI